MFIYMIIKSLCTLRQHYLLIFIKEWNIKGHYDLYVDFSTLYRVL